MTINTVWQVQFKITGSAWLDSETVYSRNVVGSALSAVVRSSITPPIPGVLRCEVTNVVGSVATITVKKVNFYDSHHPDIDETGSDFTIGATTELLISYLSITLGTGVTLGDIFEIGYGYIWDSTNSQWIRIMAMGVIIPGDFSDSIFMKITNIDARPRANVLLLWENTGDDFVSVRLENGTWIAAEDGQIQLQDANAIEGYIDPAGECTLEIRANPSVSADSSNNMVEVEMTLQSLEV